jgi:hypothetical protein
MVRSLEPEQQWPAHHYRNANQKAQAPSQSAAPEGSRNRIRGERPKLQARLRGSSKYHPPRQQALDQQDPHHKSHGCPFPRLGDSREV